MSKPLNVADKRRKALGQVGERWAVAYLQEHGYAICHLNWRWGRLGELDIVASLPEQNLLVVVEVKARNGGRAQGALEGVTLAKQRQIIALTEAYLAEVWTGPLPNVRFDVVGVTFASPSQLPEVIHLENAFVG